MPLGSAIAGDGKVEQQLKVFCEDSDGKKERTQSMTARMTSFYSVENIQPELRRPVRVQPKGSQGLAGVGRVWCSSQRLPSASLRQDASDQSPGARPEILLSATTQNIWPLIDAANTMAEPYLQPADAQAKPAPDQAPTEQASNGTLADIEMSEDVAPSEVRSLAYYFILPLISTFLWP